MKKYLSGIAIMLVLVLSACAQKKTTGANNVSFIKMERTSCFGRCPASMIEVYKNGVIRYTGRMFTEYTGVYERNVGTKKTMELMNEFTKYRVDTCKEFYENNISDLPGLYYTFTLGGKEKKIANAHFGPKFLETLAGKVDAVAKPGVGWKKIKDIKKPE